VIAIGSAFYFVSFAGRVVATLVAILCAREVAYRSAVERSARTSSCSTSATH